MPGDYRIELLARQQQAGAAPIITLLGRVPWSGLTWTDELDRPQAIQFSVPTRTLGSAAVRLRDPFTTPLEVLVSKGTTAMAHGFVQGYTAEGATSLQVYAKGLLGYLEGAHEVADLVYGPATDLNLMAKDIIDRWQASAWGNYGLVTSGIVASGTTGELTIVGAELPNVLTLLQAIGRRSGGFNLDVVPSTRVVRVRSPLAGVSRTTTAIIDRRALVTAGMSVSVAPGDVGTEARATSLTTGGETLTASATSAAVSTWGRWIVTQRYDDVDQQSTLNGHATTLVGVVARAKFSTGPTFLAAQPSLAPEAWEVGDTLGFVHDFGLGLVDRPVRVSSRRVSVPDDGGPERIQVDAQ